MNIKQQIALGSALAIFATCQTWATQPDRPLPGSYGFDWLHPESAKCEKITRRKLKKMKVCDAHPKGGSFALEYSYHACRMNGSIEYLIYETKAVCQEAKETMDANAP